MLSFQELIFSLQKFWSNYGCVILQPCDLEVGAGTSSPDTLLRALGKKNWNCAYVQPSRRPGDGRYGQNPNRTQKYYQFQVFLKPAPQNSQELYLESLSAIGLSPQKNDIRFVKDDWENPTLGAAGLGWEVWCNGLEITQFTYFQKVGGMACETVSTEITYGLERIAAYIQNVDSHFDINWNGKEGNEKITYKDVFFENEKEFSAYNFEHANIQFLHTQFDGYINEGYALLEQNLPLVAYEQCLKANHIFNLLDARGVISVTERAKYISSVRNLTKSACQIYHKKLI